VCMATTWQEPVTIAPVETRRQRMEFIKMPWDLYRDDPHWVPPLIADQREYLDPKRGVFFDHGEARLFLARKDDKALGRITAHVNYLYDEQYGAETGFFGFFESTNDPQVAEALFAAAQNYLGSRGKRRILGPMNFGVYDEIGILVQGFDTPPVVMNLHSPPYYGPLLEKLGFKKTIDWYAYHGYIKDHQQVNPKLFALNDRLIQRSGIRLRKIDLRHVQREAAIIDEIFKPAWSQNWGHVPWTERELARLVDAVKRIALPELSFIAEIQDRPVGIALSIADANVAIKKINGRLFPFGFLTMLWGLKKTDRFRHILLGVLEEYRNRGIEIAFYTKIVENARKHGYREVEMSNIVETNYSMRNSLKHFPVKVYKTYRIYEKDIHFNGK
jgi:GNAT superfamily N-acetyltransferase